MDIGETATHEHTVTEEDTATAVGSGSLAVLATPRLLAWCEAATCAVVDATIDPGRTSVGTRVELEHLVASPVGARVVVTATASYVDGRLARFDVRAEHQVGETEATVAHGQVTRVVVDRDRFLDRLPG